MKTQTVNYDPSHLGMVVTKVKDLAPVSNILDAAIRDSKMAEVRSVEDLANTIPVTEEELEAARIADEINFKRVADALAASKLTTTGWKSFYSTRRYSSIEDEAPPEETVVGRAPDAPPGIVVQAVRDDP